MVLDNYDFQRRKVLRGIGKFTVLGLGSLLIPSIGCSKKDPVSPESSGVRNKKNNYYGSYETIENRTNSNGNLTFTSEVTGESFEIKTLDDQNKGISLELRFYSDDQGNVIASSFDPNSNYFPGVYFNSSSSIQNTDSLIEIFSFLKDARDFGKSFSEGGYYDEDRLLKIPGVLYEGDWSFNDARNFVEVLTKSSFLIVPVFPGAMPIFLAAGATLGIADGVDDLIDYINENTRLNIDKNKKYEFYSIPSLGVVFFLPKISEHSTRNIRDYTRLNQGDWWIYADNYGREISVEVSGFKRIKGVDVPIMKASDGSESYKNFEGAFLKIFGEAIHSDRQNIDLIYEPPIVLGDDKLDVGKSYPNNFKEINTGITDLSYLCRWEGLEDLTLPKGTFNYCWKAKEVGDGGEISRWYAKDIGQVQIEYRSQRIKLKNYGYGGLPSEILSTRSNDDITRILLTASSR